MHLIQPSFKQAEMFAENRLPNGLVYELDFITSDEEAALLGEIKRLPLEAAPYKGYTAKRRILSFDSTYDFDDHKLHPAAAPPKFLLPLKTKIAYWLRIPAEDFAHTLITEYQPGTTLGWHRDVPQFEVVVGISLQGPCRMRFRPYPPQTNQRKNIFALNLAPRSMYVLQDEIRWRWQHSIRPTQNLRYSITFRTRTAGPPDHFS